MDRETFRRMEILRRNLKWARPGPYQTILPPPLEQQFRDWVAANGVPFDLKNPIPDYDMRGFFLALMRNDPRAKPGIDRNDQRLHYPDYWKTPFHETFSNESQWALPTAPYWVGDRFLRETGTGAVLFDDKKARR
jgi:hypothetical protein